MKKISAVIITYNEAECIERCIQSIKPVVDEIIVVDSLSTDDTVLIATQLGAKIIEQKFLGYGPQKNLGHDNAQYNWILCIDADESLSSALQDEIVNWKNAEAGSTTAYRIPRLNQYLGKFMKHGGWYPDAKVRLYQKNVGYWTNDAVHEEWKPKNPQQKSGLLTNCMYHYTFRTVKQHLDKIEKYTELSALEAVRKGKKMSLLKAVLVPHWVFVHRYIFRLGILDGYEGYLLSKMAAFEKWLKYHKIRKYNKDLIKLR